MSDLGLKASVRVDNSGATGPLNDTAAAARAATSSFTGLGTAARTTAADVLRSAAAMDQAVGGLTNVTALGKRAKEGMDELARAQDRVTRSAGAMRAGTMQLGQQIGDVSQGLATGINPMTIFAQQAGQTAYALSQMGGKAAIVGEVLSGPLGAAALGAALIFAPFVIDLFKGADAADDLAKSTKSAADAFDDFQKRQSNIGQFIDETTGKLIKQNGLLIANAALLAQKQIADNQGKINDAGAKALAAVQGVATTGSRFVSERHADAPVYDPAIIQALAAATNKSGVLNIVKLNEGFQALAKTRPELKKVADAILEQAAYATDLTAKNAALSSQYDVLTGKTLGAAKASASMVEKQVALATATTDVERARARLALVQTEGAAAEKTGTAAIEAYRAKLTAATTAVNDAEAAQKAATEAQRGASKETREAEAAAKLLAAENTKLVASYNPLANAALQYADALNAIAKAEVRGLITADQADQARLDALEARSAAEDKALRDRLKSRGVTLFNSFEDDGKQAIDHIGDSFLTTLDKASTDHWNNFEDQGLTAATAIGQALGGSLGNAISTAAGLAQGVATGNFTGLGSRAGGIATLASGLLGGKQGTSVDARPGGLGFSTRQIVDAGLGTTSQNFSVGFSSVSEPFKRVAEGLDKFLGNSAGSFAKTAGNAFAGAAQGQIAGSVAGALGIKTSSGGSAIGGAIGGALAPLLGPLGPFAGMIGGLLGGVLGNLLAGVKKASSTVSISGGTASVSTTGNNAALQKASSTQANGLIDGLQALADQLGGVLGSASVSIGQRNKDYVVDPTGKGRTKGSGVLKFKSQEEALQAALADAINDGGVSGVSPRVQSVLHTYADNVNKAVAEAMKVKGLEDILANRENPFSTVFRDFEMQARQRIDVAKKYGFDVLEIEKINGEARAALVAQTLQQATGSVKALLDDLKFGSRAAGSIDQRRTALEAERDRLLTLAKTDPSQNDAAAKIISQLIDLSTEAFGKTGASAAVRDQAVSQLQDLVTQTEARITAASAAANTDQTAAKLTELNSSVDDQTVLLQKIYAELQTANLRPSAATADLAAAYARIAV